MQPESNCHAKRAYAYSDAETDNGPESSATDDKEVHDRIEKLPVVKQAAKVEVQSVDAQVRDGSFTASAGAVGATPFAAQCNIPSIALSGGATPGPIHVLLQCKKLNLCSTQWPTQWLNLAPWHWCQ